MMNQMQIKKYKMNRKTPNSVTNCFEDYFDITVNVGTYDTELDILYSI